MDLKLSDTGDLDISNGDVTMLTGDEAISQHVSIRCKTCRGEWLLDTLNGIPFFQYVFVKNPNRVILDAIFREAIEKTAGVNSVKSLKFDFTGADRSMRLTIVAEKSDGSILDFEELYISI